METNTLAMMKLVHEIIHFGWVMTGYCRYYKIGRRDVVIGPIETLEKERGKGVATFALKNAINNLFHPGQRVVYIDTSDNNFGAQKVFQNCGFGDPVDSYLRM